MVMLLFSCWHPWTSISKAPLSPCSDLQCYMTESILRDPCMGQKLTKVSSVGTNSDMLVCISFKLDSKAFIEIIMVQN